MHLHSPSPAKDNLVDNKNWSVFAFVQQSDYTLPLLRMKSEKYERILASAQALISGEKDLIANLANVAALIKTEFDFWWVGFYLVKDDELVLGPFQGPVACTRISKGKGVCGTSWKLSTSIVVPDVHKFEGHIACSAASNSEIVVPLIHENKVWGVLDIDSSDFDTFNEEDRIYLEKLVSLIAPI